MSGITLTDAQAQLAAWMQASLSVAQGQSYRIADRELRRADAQYIMSQIKFWESKIAQLTRASQGHGGIRFGQVISCE